MFIVAFKKYSCCPSRIVAKPSSPKLFQGVQKNVILQNDHFYIIIVAEYLYYIIFFFIFYYIFNVPIHEYESRLEEKGPNEHETFKRLFTA